MHESSIKINEMVNKSHKGQQTSEIIDRLTYNVFIQPNTGIASSKDSIMSRHELTQFYDYALSKKEKYEKEIENANQKVKYWEMKFNAMK